jgi:sulfur carrier protein
MQLRINGQPYPLEQPISLHHLMEKLGYEQKSIAVALNGRFIPRHQYFSCILEDAQELEVVSPMQGG